VPICVALLSLASLGLAGVFAALRADSPPHAPDQTIQGGAAPASGPVEGVLRSPAQGREAAAKKTWM
jgi:hypothetical protein